MPGWKNDLIDLADYAFKRLRSRVEGLTDDEYLWEPAPGCWTIRPDEHGRYRGDWASPVWPAPFTTIAWRLGHMINNLFDARYATNFGLTPVAAAPDSLPGTAVEALSALDEGYRVTRGYLETLSDADLGEKLGERAGPWAEDDKASFVLHMLDELIHHAAEVGVLRDLYRATRPPNPVVEALLAGDRAAAQSAVADVPEAMTRARSEWPDLLVQAATQRRWSAVPLLLEAGFPMAMPDGTSALHHAAAAGELGVVRQLIDEGADPASRDSLFRADALGWAEYFGQTEVADYLRTLPAATGGL